MYQVGDKIHELWGGSEVVDILAQTEDDGQLLKVTYCCAGQQLTETVWSNEL